MAISRTIKLGLIAGAVLLAGVAAWLAFGWFEVQQLWLDDEVDEDLTTFFANPDDGAGAGGSPSTATSGDEGSTPPSDSSPPTEAVLIGTGSFTGVEGHTVSGQVNLIQQPDGSYLVQFPDLDAENGPDLVVWLTTDDTSSPVIELGELKGNQGSQEYVIPSGTSVEDFSTVVIWCRRFSVGFAEAPLS